MKWDCCLKYRAALKILLACDVVFSESSSCIVTWSKNKMCKVYEVINTIQSVTSSLFGGMAYLLSLCNKTTVSLLYTQQISPSNRRRGWKRWEAGCTVEPYILSTFSRLRALSWSQTETGKILWGKRFLISDLTGDVCTNWSTPRPWNAN